MKQQSKGNPVSKMEPSLEAISQEVTAGYLHRSSVTFLECAISVMATHMSVEAVAGILEEEARQLREFG